MGADGGEVMYFGSFCSDFGFLNCDDVCMYVVNIQFGFLEFVFNSVLFFLFQTICQCLYPHYAMHIHQVNDKIIILSRLLLLCNSPVTYN